MSNVNDVCEMCGMYEITLKDTIVYWVVSKHSDHEEWVYIHACKHNFVRNIGAYNEERLYKIQYVRRTWTLSDKNIISL